MKNMKRMLLFVTILLVALFTDMVNAIEINNPEELITYVPNEITVAPIEMIENRPENIDAWQLFENFKEEADVVILANLEKQNITFSDEYTIGTELVFKDIVMNGEYTYNIDIYHLEVAIMNKTTGEVLNNEPKTISIKFKGDFDYKKAEALISKSASLNFSQNEFIFYYDIQNYDEDEMAAQFEELLLKKLKDVTYEVDIATGSAGGGYNGGLEKMDMFLLLFEDGILYQTVTFTVAGIPSLSVPKDINQSDYIAYATPLFQEHYNEAKGAIGVVQKIDDEYYYLENYEDALEIERIEEITDNPVRDMHQGLTLTNGGVFYRIYFKSDIEDSIYATVAIKKENTPNVNEIKKYLIPITSVTLNKTNLSMVKGKTEKLVATINPSNPTSDTTLEWTSSNTKVATVDKSGNIKAIGAGTATITVKTSNGKTATVKVTVTNPNVPITSVKINQKSLNVMIGKTSKLTATINPSNTTQSKNLTWTSSNKKIATVDKNGNVKGIKAGTANITVKTSNGKTATIKVTVKKPTPIKSVKLNKKTLKLELNKTYQLKATINPSNTTDSKVLTWSTSNKKVAIVDKNGKITAVGGGSATITVKTANKKKATVKVTVSKINAKKATISAIKNQVQTGKALKPSVQVKLNGKVLKNRTDYTVSYKNNKNAGKATVTVKFKGNYTGTKTGSFIIVPSKVNIKNPSTSKKSITVKYSKVSGAKYYQTAYRLKGTNKWSYTTKSKISKLTSGKEYEVMIRAGIKSVKNTIYGTWSNVKTIKVK